MGVKSLIPPMGVKRVIPLIAAAAVAAAAVLRPVPPPTVAAGTGTGGWSSTPPDPRGGRVRHTLAPQAMVYVAGDVVRPGVYAVRPEARTRDALALAGGARPDADLVAVNLAAHIRDGDEIVVPARDAAGPANAIRGSRGNGRGRRAGGPRRSTDGGTRGTSASPGASGTHGAGGKKRHRRSWRGEPPPAEVDVNTADAETLASVPGVGEGLAKRIIAFREQNGAFASVDELLDVAGITEHRLDAMLPYVVAR